MFLCSLMAWLDNPHAVNEGMSAWRPHCVLTSSLAAALATQSCWYWFLKRRSGSWPDRQRSWPCKALFLSRGQGIVDSGLCPCADEYEFRLQNGRDFWNGVHRKLFPKAQVSRWVFRALFLRTDKGMTFTPALWASVTVMIHFDFPNLSFSRQSYESDVTFHRQTMS